MPLSKKITVHKMKLAVAPFEKIANGSKIIESRLYDERRRQIDPGDRIEFSCNNNPNQKVNVIVRALYRYPSFESMFSDFPPFYFGGSSKNDLIKEIGIFYSKEDQDKYGVIGIKIEIEK